jgi:hypothetical protein
MSPFSISLRSSPTAIVLRECRPGEPQVPLALFRHEEVSMELALFSGLSQGGSHTLVGVTPEHLGSVNLPA